MNYRRTVGGLRNPIEHWFKVLKSRTNCFYNNIPSKSIERGFINLKSFLETFAGIYNLLKALS